MTEQQERTLVMAAGGPWGKDRKEDPPWWLSAWRDNADLIAHVAQLPAGYLASPVLDVTVGKHAGFWKRWRPEQLVTNDLDPEVDAMFHLDCQTISRRFSERFASVVFDPDYKLNGTPALGEQDVRYGTGEDLKRIQRMSKILYGAAEAFRCVRPRGHLLVKCMDQVESGRQWWQGDSVTEILRPLGAVKVEEFYLFGGTRPQPPRDKKCPACKGAGKTPTPVSQTLVDCEPCDGTGRVASEQQHAYGRPSKLLVFYKGKPPTPEEQ